MNRNTIIREPKRLADEASKLNDNEAFSENHTRWMSGALSLLEDVFGRNSRDFLSFAALPWRAQGSMLI